MKKLILLLMSISLLTVFSCRVKEGEAGLPGESALNQNGSVSGTLFYKMANGDTAIVPFNFAYYASLQDNEFYYDSVSDEYYDFNFTRRESKEANSYMYLNGYGYLDALAQKPQTPENVYLYFSLTRNINGQLFSFGIDGASFSPGNPDCTITNFSLNTTTGLMEFDYELIADPYDIDSDYRIDYSTNAIIKGRVSINVNRSEYTGGGE